MCVQMRVCVSLCVHVCMCWGKMVVHVPEEEMRTDAACDLPLRNASDCQVRDRGRKWAGVKLRAWALTVECMPRKVTELPSVVP